MTGFTSANQMAWSWRPVPGCRRLPDDVSWRRLRGARPAPLQL